jgi:hypothetical protein
LKETTEEKARSTWQTMIGLNNLKRALIGLLTQEHVAKRSFTFTVQVFGAHSISLPFRRKKEQNSREKILDSIAKI